MKRFACILAALLTGGFLQAAEAPAASFCTQWRFLRADPPGAASQAFDDSSWETVALPHTAHVEALVAGQASRQWQGICWYRKTFRLPAGSSTKKVFLDLDGAMNVAEVWVNGKSAGKFMGGYLPYIMDISPLVLPDAANLLAVRLDNRDNPLTGPKPLADLDFNLYSGLYRGANLVLKDKLHITDPLLADRIAGGGVFVTFPAVSSDEATVRVQTHLLNEDNVTRNPALRTTLLDATGHTVAVAQAPPSALVPGGDTEVIQQLVVPRPQLWSPANPSLYEVQSEVVDGGELLDLQQTRVGIRRILMDEHGFSINGRKMFLRGANRHQEYPYIGNALPDAAQYRDALKIKQAGFDYVRLSHYPQSPAFLDACDELGLVVMDCVMGWQYFGPDPAFTTLKLQECRQLIRRDRNHPCAVLWEVSLNESAMPKTFVERANAIAHQEYPGDQCYTAGWMRGYDVFMQARQHGGCRDINNRLCLVSEYGDWEYYAQNAGLSQTEWKNLKPEERNSRQLRGDGEARLLQQARNFQEAHNDNLKTSAFADGVWVMFDYNRGYAPDLESSGVMDIFRLPKFSYWLFRSQRDAGEPVAGTPVEPSVFIANYWTPQSPLDVRVFSNCEEVGLYLNHTLLERRPPDRSRLDSNLRHPPVTFNLARFQPGALRAVGYISGREVAHHERRTPGEVASLALRFDTGVKAFAQTGKDAVFCYADLTDSAGTVVPTARVPVFLGAVGQAALVGHNPILSEAGTASILLLSDSARPSCSLFALCFLKEGGKTRILSAAASPGRDEIPSYQIRYTMDGTSPSLASPQYSGPIPNASHLRAALLVQGQTVALADSRVGAASTADKPAPIEQAALH